jgi:hypothetical protein
MTVILLLTAIVGGVAVIGACAVAQAFEPVPDWIADALTVVVVAGIVTFGSGFLGAILAGILAV